LAMARTMKNDARMCFTNGAVDGRMSRHQKNGDRICVQVDTALGPPQSRGGRGLKRLDIDQETTQSDRPHLLPHGKGLFTWIDDIESVKSQVCHCHMHGSSPMRCRRALKLETQAAAALYHQ